MFFLCYQSIFAGFYVNIDAAAFSHSRDSIAWELYYSFLNNDIKYEENNGIYTAEIFFDVRISSGLETYDYQWIFTNSVDNISQTENLYLFGVKKFVIKEGQYEVKFLINDVNDSSSIAEHKLKFFTPEFKFNKIEASDIQLSKYGILKNNAMVKWDKMFDKNDFYIIPNPMLEYTESDKTVKFYYELYNAKYYATDGLSINYKIYDAINNLHFDSTFTMAGIDDFLNIYDEINIEFLPTGIYYLNISALYPFDEPTDSLSRIKKFYFTNSNKPAEAPSVYYAEAQKFEHSEFAAMSPEQIEHELELVRVIATSYEKEQLERLATLKAKQRFLFNYWIAQDFEPATYENERLNEVRKAEDYANTYFSWGSSKNGWKTDRGRVLLKYGFPTDIEREVANANLRAWSEWWYSDIQGGVRFYFVDLNGFGDFKLVHSTAIGELYFTDWYNQFVPDSKGDPFDEGR